MDSAKELYGVSDFQTYLFNSGNNFKAYEFLGCHKAEFDGVSGWRFAVWAPKAKAVKIACDKNGWSGDGMDLMPFGETGVWVGFFADFNRGDYYKYAITAPDNEVFMRADPYARHSELRPGTASVVYGEAPYKWTDKKWLENRIKKDNIHSPINIYECNIGSWRVHEDGSFYNYEEVADELVPYLVEMGYTHLELMPLTEFPFDGSWGYQVTGYFSATSRYGTPEQLKKLIDKCHGAGIGVIMDWVPAHFPRDAHGLRMFDGTPCYEYADWREGEHKDWGTMVFDFAKGEVISFLMSSAYFWAEEYHIDGLRVDAVSSMLYRDYSRNDGEWVANKYGGNGNLEAVELLKRINITMGTEKPGFLMIAEESTAWPLVTAPPENDGLGFHFKWNMGWMNDTLRYVSMNPYFRKDNHSLLTFLMMYAFSENFILPLSHDEVVHGKKSLLDKMFGSYEDKFNAYKTFLTYYMTMPGKKLMFMGGEIGQFLEWRYDEQLEWNILELDPHKNLNKYVKALNSLYKENKALWELEQSWDGFKWINEADNENSVVSYIRKGKKPEDLLAVVTNFTAIDRGTYKIGVPYGGGYEVILHSNSTEFGGDRKINKMTYIAKQEPFGDMDYTITLPIDGNSAIVLKRKIK